MHGNDQLYGIIRSSDHDLILPFICTRCGQCCREYGPQISAAETAGIAKYLNMPEDEVMTRHTEAYVRFFSDSPT